MTANEAEAPPPPTVGAGRAALLINARSRRGRLARDVASAALSRSGLDLVRVLRVSRPGRMGPALEAVLRQGIDRLIVGGGDGTIGSVAPRAARSGVTLGVLPLGTANDFARTLGIPADLDRAAEVAAGSVTTAVDLARANDAYFLNVASVGLSVAATQALSPLLKRTVGPIAYAVAGCGPFFAIPRSDSS